MYCAIYKTCHGKNFLIDSMQRTTTIWKNKWKLLVNYEVTTHQILECFPVLQKTSSLNYQVNVYTFSISSLGFANRASPTKTERFAAALWRRRPPRLTGLVSIEQKGGGGGGEGGGWVGGRPEWRRHGQLGRGLGQGRAISRDWRHPGLYKARKRAPRRRRQLP